jgi:hypothetical protein
VMAFREIEYLMSLKEPTDKTRMLQPLLNGQALSYFEHHFRRRLEAEVSELPDNDFIEILFRGLYIDLE